MPLRRSVAGTEPALGVVAAFVWLVAACSPAPTTALTASPAPSSPTPPPPRPPSQREVSLVYHTPDWFSQAVVYEVFVRSFADSNGDGVGDLDGLTSRLDYIASLGTNTLWLMPIHPSPSAHGYDVTDYLAVHPDYGTLQDLQELVEAAHQHRMRVLLDFVPSHLSREHPYFQDAFANPASPYSGWFLWTNEQQTAYASFDGEGTMPRLNHRNPDVVGFLAQAMLFWLDLDSDGDYRDGIDGFRVDNVTFPPPEALRVLRQRVKQANPEAVLLGEAWVTEAADLSRYFADQFDALFDFPLYSVLAGNHDLNGDGLLSGGAHPALATRVLNEAALLYPPAAHVLRFLSSHDTNRIASEVRADPSRQRLAAVLLASLPGPVMLYYGEEIGMLGEKGGPPAWDNYRREPMDWYASQAGSGQTTWFRPNDRWNQPFDGISVEEQELDSHSLLNLYRQMLRLRNEHPALSLGSVEILRVQASARGAWSFRRDQDGETIVAAFNFSDAPLEVTLEQMPIGSAAVVDLITGERYPAASVSAPYVLTLRPASAVLLSATLLP